MSASRDSNLRFSTRIGLLSVFATAAGDRTRRTSTDEARARRHARRGARPLWIVFFVLMLMSSEIGTVLAQRADLSFLLTRAEETDFRETTRYDEVMAFVEVVAGNSDHIHRTTFGYSAEGRALPLVVFGRVRDASPASVKRNERTRVFLQANIHAGEVEGKETVLMLLRDMGMGRYDHLLDSMIVLIAPLYNADGNERISLYNRPRQDGPEGGMGTRASSQGLDLNRDHMKLATPETRSIVRLMTDYDPHVMVDLHATNGTTHAYHLTYSPPLHPATPAAIQQFMNETWLPAQSEAMAADGYLTFDYGNLPWPGMDAPRGWYTFDYRPRFGTNYAGLRNRIAILSEAYSYLSFEDRIRVSRSLVEHTLKFALENGTRIRRLVRDADRSVVGESIPLRAEFEPTPGPVEILMGEVRHDRHDLTGETVYRRKDVVHRDSMTAYVSFRSTHDVVAPETYFIPPDLHGIIDNLRAHGIRVDTLQAAAAGMFEQFEITSLTRSQREFQGVHELSAEGSYVQTDRNIPAGWLRVEVAQPLGRLASVLLEPTSSDGLLNWAVFGSAVEPDEDFSDPIIYPVVRRPAPR